MTARISSLSKEYVIVQVDTSPGGQTLSIGTASVEFAFPASGEPLTWFTGEWQTVSQQNYARVLVGPGSTVGVLPDGVYTVWIRVSQNPETVVRPAGVLVVT